MDTLIDWLPRIGALFTLIIGLVGFFKPKPMVEGMDIQLTSAKATSEARVVFGAMLVGTSLGALLFHEPLIYITLGMGWLLAVVARFVSMVVDKATLQQSQSGLIVDAVLAFLFLSGLLFT